MFAFCCQDEEEAGLLELLKSQICDNAALYAQKYDEEFQPYLPRFVTAIWNLLVTTGQEVKYDLVSITAFFSQLEMHFHDTCSKLDSKVHVFNFHFLVVGK